MDVIPDETGPQKADHDLSPVGTPRGRYDPDMPESPISHTSPSTPATTIKQLNVDAVHCERCSAEMFRMHAVWRCPACGFKTDCCGW
jgi:ribosomal protein L37E